MKRLKYTMLLALIIFSINSQGDIIITEQPTKHKHIITNLTDYPDVVVFVKYGLKGVPKLANMGFARVPKDGVIKKHLYSEMELYAVKKEYLENREDEDIDWKDKQNVIRSNMTILPDYEKTGLENIPEVKHEYEIMGFKDTSMVVFKTKEIYRYNESLHQADSIQYFKYEGDLAKLQKKFN